MQNCCVPPTGWRLQRFHLKTCNTQRSATSWFQDTLSLLQEQCFQSTVMTSLCCHWLQSVCKRTFAYIADMLEVAVDLLSYAAKLFAFMFVCCTCGLTLCLAEPSSNNDSTVLNNATLDCKMDLPSLRTETCKAVNCTRSHNGSSSCTTTCSKWPDTTCMHSCRSSDALFMHSDWCE